MPAQRAPSVAAWLGRLPFPFRAHAHALAALVREAAPDAEERIKYGVPMWAVVGRDFCYLTFGPSKGKGVAPKVSVGFQDGTSLPDPERRLVKITTNAKAARHVVVRLDEDVPARAVRDLVRAAAGLAVSKRERREPGRLRDGTGVAGPVRGSARRTIVQDRKRLCE